MIAPYACPECLTFGCVRLVSRSQLRELAWAAGVRLVKGRHRGAVRYWWCDRCENGGAVYRWESVTRGA